ncbi:MAG: stage V sporulation protein S [Candidatus Bipolaricaulota bacterium]
MEILKVASSSNPNSVAGAIAGAIESDGIVEVHSIGAGAVNQSVKAIAIARRLVDGDETQLSTIPGFIDLEIEGEEKTGIKFVIELVEKDGE